ncbi:MAG: TPM domain-containing protein [bacterium]|nr:TPM domain-containing protein [bacterium]
MMITLMNRFGALAAFVLATLLGSLPASAAGFIQDGAQMFSPDTVAQLNAKISNFNAQTGKAIVVVTVPSLNGETLQNAAQQVFTEQHVNGVLIFIAKNDRRDIIVPGTATAQFFPAGTTASIRHSMESLFKAEDYDAGITAAVNGVLDVFRAHLGQNGRSNTYPATTSQSTLARSNSGGHIPVFVWIIILVIGYLVLRSIFRAMSGPRSYGGPGMGGPGMPGAGMPGPGYPPGGGYGYGGPGYYGGGGGFWSGLLGGLGGAWLGNEMFGGNRGTTIIEQGGGQQMMPGDQGGGWGGGNAGGWGQDSGPDMGASSAGDWSGGGFGGGDSGGWGGGDSGGGFGGDSGGGDSGGGW